MSEPAFTIAALAAAAVIGGMLLGFAIVGALIWWARRRQARDLRAWEILHRSAELERRVWEAAVYRAGRDPEDVGR